MRPLKMIGQLIWRGVKFAGNVLLDFVYPVD
jgi:hypothetical protein